MLDTLEQEAMEVYAKNNHLEMSDVEEWKDSFEEAYQGHFQDPKDFTYQLIDDTCLLDSMPENLRFYFDYDLFHRDLFISDYYEIEGYVFRAY